LVTYGGATGARVVSDERQIFWKKLEIIGTTMGSRREFEKVMDLVFRGELRPVIDIVWPLERARDAHERLEEGEQFGKIVLVPWPGRIRGGQQRGDGPDWNGSCPSSGRYTSPVMEERKWTFC